jgi:hypothetical protein
MENLRDYCVTSTTKRREEATKKKIQQAKGKRKHEEKYCVHSHKLNK